MRVELKGGLSFGRGVGPRARCHQDALNCLQHQGVIKRIRIPKQTCSMTFFIPDGSVSLQVLWCHGFLEPSNI